MKSVNDNINTKLENKIHSNIRSTINRLYPYDGSLYGKIVSLVRGANYDLIEGLEESFR